MANEINIQWSLNVRVPNVMPRPFAFTFNRACSSYQGPTPGYLTATTTGVQITTTGITDPSVAIFSNLSTDARLLIGIKDTSSGAFEPLLELDPLEAWPIPLARMLGSELSGGAGTGTAGSGGVLWAKGVDASVNFIADIFGR